MPFVGWGEPTLCHFQHIRTGLSCLLSASSCLFKQAFPKGSHLMSEKHRKAGAKLRPGKASGNRWQAMNPWVMDIQDMGILKMNYLQQTLNYLITIGPLKPFCLGIYLGLFNQNHSQTASSNHREKQAAHVRQGVPTCPAFTPANRKLPQFTGGSIAAHLDLGEKSTAQTNEQMLYRQRLSHGNIMAKLI